MRPSFMRLLLDHGEKESSLDDSGGRREKGPGNGDQGSGKRERRNGWLCVSVVNSYRQRRKRRTRRGGQQVWATVAVVRVATGYVPCPGIIQILRNTTGLP